MNYIIEFTPQARKQLQKLGKPIQRRVYDKIKYFGKASHISIYAEHLKGFKIPTYRFRIGDFRIIFNVKNEIVTIIKVGHRRDIYKR